ncbi:MAG: PD40 domain-containing protein [Spirochaetes bacterium]|nr:PD40 domain-containing protein [Spirochaetota bacterium]
MHKVNIYIRTIFFIMFFLFLHARLSAQVVHVDKVVSLDPPINSAGADFAPSFTADGKILVFNSKRSGSAYQQIFISRFENDAWTNPESLDIVNSKYNDESPHITPDGAFLFFSSDRDGSFEIPKDASGRIRVSFDLYVSKNMDGRWTSPIKVPGKVNTYNHERTPSLSIDALTLYYTSMPFGDVGKARVMKAEYIDGEFVNPQPLPEPVNVNAQETGLVPSLDGKGFYFSSRRDGGYGGWDLYYVKYDKGAFGYPVNLGSEINSPQNEINLSLINDSIFFCSDRKGGYGSYDIYTAKISVEDDALKIIVRDKKTKEPLQVELQLSAKVKENDKVASHEIKKKTDAKGEAVVKYNPKVKNVDVSINEEGYLPVFDTIDVALVKGKPQIFELSRIEKEASFDIHAIYFDFESAKIKPESYPYLDAFSEYLKKHSTMRFEIIGHTDLHGSDEFNDKLSLDRAKSVKEYFVGKGLHKDRFTVKGIGKRQPIIPKLGPDFDEKNRRTEFKLLEK